MHSRIHGLGITVLALSAVAALAAPAVTEKPAARDRALERPATSGSNLPPRIAEVSFFEVRDRPLHDALRLLFKAARREHKVDADVPNPRVTIKVNQLSFDDALGRLLAEASKASPGIVA